MVGGSGAVATVHCCYVVVDIWTVEWNCTPRPVEDQLILGTVAQTHTRVDFVVIKESMNNVQIITCHLVLISGYL